MFYFLKNGKKRDFIILSIIYILSQGFLLIVSGRWWDDWCLYNESDVALRQFALELGRPSIIPIYKTMKLLPEPGYRWITFLLFYFSMISIYKILRNWLKIDYDACFWICALFSTIPANDARILLSVFPYTLGFFFFTIGMSYLTEIIDEESFLFKKRLVSYVFFFIGFILNSTLFYYSIVLMMILTARFRHKDFKKIVMWLDYLLLPVLYYLIKLFLFPAHGEYEGYNKVSLGKIVNAIKILPRADIEIFRNLHKNLKGTGLTKYALIVSAFVVVLIFWNWIKKLFAVFTKRDYLLTNNNDIWDSIGESLKIVLSGIVVLSCALFPYIVVRQNVNISTTGWVGRDSILVALGVSMVIYGLSSLLFRKGMSRLLFIWIILCGCVHFNRWYLSYQQDYYRQKGFQYQLTLHENELENAKNIVYINSDKGLINCQHFYQLNGNAEMVFGNQTRMIVGGFNSTKYFSPDMQADISIFVDSDNYHMSEYDVNYKHLDAIISYDCDVSLLATAKLKYYELFLHRKFEESLRDNSHMNVYMDGTDGYFDIINEQGYVNYE